MMPLLAALVFLPGDSFQEALGWGKMNGKHFKGIFSGRSTKVDSMPSSSASGKASQNSSASRQDSSQASQSSVASSNN